MPNFEMAKLRKDFDTAITSNRNEVMLDPFVESCSIYSRGQLRECPRLPKAMILLTGGKEAWRDLVHGIDDGLEKQKAFGW